MKNPSLNILGGTKYPTEANRYLARDGLYYNGYALSSDCADDFFGDAFKEMANNLARDLGLDPEDENA